MTGDIDEELMRRVAMGDAAALEERQGRRDCRIWRYLTRHRGEPALIVSNLRARAIFRAYDGPLITA